ncbi:MAG TPA: response regulator transcription factor [Steroidobacteraceae bacterium]|nr:response regulator transcription factor [Steroidobacteraceae bacterium]
MKILLVDDHALFRAGLRLLLRTIRHDAEILEAGTLDEAFRHCERHPDVQVCLLDLSLRTENGLAALASLKEQAPEIAIVVVSGAEDIGTIRRCVDAGAMSYIPKSLPPEVLTEALHNVLQGQLYLPRQVLELDRDSPAPALTPRQCEVLGYLSRGWPTKAICREMGLSEHTVKEHLSLIFQALGAHNRTDAVIKAASLAAGSSGLGVRIA